MHRYRYVQKLALLTIIGLPGFMLLNISPVRVVSLWLLGLVAFTAAHIYRVHYRKQAALRDTDSEE